MADTIFPSTWTFDQRLAAWNEAQTELEAAKLTEMKMRLACFGEAFPNAIEGTHNRELGGGYILKGNAKMNYSLANGKGETRDFVSRMMKMGGESAFIAERLVKWKPELSITEYKGLKGSFAQAFMKAEILTIKPGTPSMEIVAPKAVK